MAYNFSNFKNDSASVEQWLRKEYDGIRTSRAAPSILDGVNVEAYGSKMPLKQVSSIVSSDPRTLYVSPYDQSQIKDIEKAITDADLGLSVGSDEKGVRVSFPELTGERRDSLIKLSKEKLEEARISIRKHRDETMKDIENQEEKGSISEDERFRLKDELQKHVDVANKTLEEMYKKKETEIKS